MSTTTQKFTVWTWDDRFDSWNHFCTCDARENALLGQQRVEYVMGVPAFIEAWYPQQKVTQTRDDPRFRVVKVRRH